MTDLVFVHGRSQQDKDADDLKQEWISALQVGLERAGLTLPIPPSRIRMPYYGNTLRDMVKGVPTVAEIVIRGDGPETDREALLRAVVEELRADIGITDAEIAEEVGADVVERGPQDWNWVRAVLRRLDRYAPSSATTVALFTNDVHKYLHSTGIRERIDVGVRDAVTPGVPAVVVGHSLGSVVAYNILRRDGHALRWQIPLYLTVGSPLAITAIRNQLTSVEHPSCVAQWYNARDRRDIVALHELNGRHFAVTPAVENFSGVINGTDNRHGISGYLSDPTVAARIHAALV